MKRCARHPVRRRKLRRIVRALSVGTLLIGLLLIPSLLLKRCIWPPEGEPRLPAAPTAAIDGENTLSPPNPATDRGPQRLRLSERRCHALHPSFQARVIGDGLCEVWLHDLTRQGNTLWLTASPRHGVAANGRPVIALLPETALPQRTGSRLVTGTQGRYTDRIRMVPNGAQ